ncbi:hypothetical protein GLA29479_1305 [Lysobacter antibioticus]|uniref:Uncharacterized protein n=1 Tax=Lysobacter antibioticus TaxID=84531 RepID=A0A0S2DUX4_LYSAN|nr:hypothetical protein GLA29479_1305 [Lysobacter antibioticus]ALN78230.1 hypothetical protein LA76x_0068 [Lysobacter antibioticus]
MWAVWGRRYGAGGVERAMGGRRFDDARFQAGGSIPIAVCPRCRRMGV